MKKIRSIHSCIAVEGDAIGFWKRLCVLTMGLIFLFPDPSLAQSVLACTHLSATTPSLNSSASESEPASDNASPDDFPVWKAISLGTYNNVEAVRDALNKTPSPCPIYVGLGASEVLGRLHYSETSSS